MNLSCIEPCHPPSPWMQDILTKWNKKQPRTPRSPYFGRIVWLLPQQDISNNNYYNQVKNMIAKLHPDNGESHKHWVYNLRVYSLASLPFLELRISDLDTQSLESWGIPSWVSAPLSVITVELQPFSQYWMKTDLARSIARSCSIVWSLDRSPDHWIACHEQ